jgi:hypothetical protein
MSTEATWLHLSIAHGFSDWTDQDLAEHYPSFTVDRGRRVDVAGLHTWDHQEHQQDLDHDHREA